VEAPEELVDIARIDNHIRLRPGHATDSAEQI
jgi:hypothetical protein